MVNCFVMPVCFIAASAQIKKPHKIGEAFLLTGGGKMVTLPPAFLQG